MGVRKEKPLKIPLRDRKNRGKARRIAFHLKKISFFGKKYKGSIKK
jgi:hypothetical protein